MPQPEPQTTDLSEQVPGGWTLQGLSAPRWDGRNFYRAPIAPSSRVEFTVPELRFVQFRYELQSPRQDVVGRVWLNGRLLDTFTFPAGRSGDRVVAGFGRLGVNTLRTDYLCGGSPCRGVPIYQYWTQVTLLHPQPAREDTGLGVQQWWLDGVQTPLRSSGTGPTLFDGANYGRAVSSPGFTLTWPEGTRPLYVAFQLNGRGPFEATARVNGEVIWRQQGDPRRYLSPTLSLGGRPGVREVQVGVSCAPGPPDCATLYFARAAVIPPEVAPAPGPAALLGGGASTALLLVWLARALGLLRRRPRAAG